MITFASRFALFTAIAATVVLVPATATAGTPVRDSKFEYTVTEAKNIGSRIDTDRGWRRADGTFEVVTVTITNIGAKRQGLFGSRRLLDIQGHAFEEDSEATFRLGAGTAADYGWSLDPGESVTHQIVFDIPVDADPAYLVISDLQVLFSPTEAKVPV
ncbi:DUF4352 domain-containing protein [Nocardia sp. NPDC006044]|uniref:DUF4352 domain-containing protein n=1 Tax=Nocardia sp. NPDC006044 TaxID=3364306 RepID=UPI0036C744F3